MSVGENVAFAILAVLIISSSVLMINFTKVVHMVVSLAVVFLSLAGMYVLLEAEFVAFVQVLIYAGAISILMIFGIMMTRHDEQEQPKQPVFQALLLSGSVALFGIIFYAIQSTAFTPSTGFEQGADNTKAIGELLYTQHVIPFELISVLLTVAFIGAIVLAKREEE
ncbi:MAG: NADH-quinone oxidoreductase subunit J [Paenibacillaceae bacterium]